MHQLHRRDARRRQGSRTAALLGLLLLSAPAAPAVAADRLDPPANAPAAEAALRERLAEWKDGRDGIQVLEPLLAERIARLRADSPSFDRAWRDLEGRGSAVVIGTRSQLAGVLPSDIRRSDAWAGITVVWGGRELERSAVGIRLDWLRGLHQRFGNPEEVFLAALDDLLVHEIYGHLVPVAEADDPRERCADPGPGERLAESCVGRRELALKSERTRHVAARLAEERLAVQPEASR